MLDLVFDDLISKTNNNDLISNFPNIIVKLTLILKDIII
jgi:hypothetical protein